jgi:hypothetical protein
VIIVAGGGQFLPEGTDVVGVLVPQFGRRLQRLPAGAYRPAVACRSVPFRDSGSRWKFLIKVGGRPGIPVQIGLTSIEASLNDTNKRWHAPAATLLEPGTPGLTADGAA